MNLVEKIEEDFKTALRSQDASKVGVLRMLKSALKNKAVEKKTELEEADVISIIKSEAKKRKESIEAFTKAERHELVEKEKAELKLLDEYLPEQLSDDKIKEVITSVRSGLDEDDKKNFGKVMGAVMAELKGQADGQKVGELVKASLSKD
jgi:uncharacterized protein YqeY